MPLVNTKEMFKKAYEGGYAVGAFNVNNMEIVQGITEAAGELKSPVILMGNKGQRKGCLCPQNKCELLSHKSQCQHGCLYCYWSKDYTK